MRRPSPKQVAALVAATAALVAAIVGNLQLRASSTGSTAGREADRAAAAVVSGYVAGQSSLEHERDLDALVAQFERRRAVVTRRALVTAREQDATGLRDQGAVWAAQRDAALDLSPVLAAAAERARSGDQDAPTLAEASADALDAYAADLSEVADLGELRQAAQSREASAWGAKGDAYAAALALLAVAVFLSALSLVVVDRLRRWTLVPAVVLVVAGVVWAGSTARGSVAATPERALAAVADGDRLLAVGRTDEAEDRYEQALAVDPELPEAHVGRSDVHALVALDRAGEGPVAMAVVQDSVALAQAIDEAEHASRIGYADAALWLQLGSLRYLAGDVHGALSANREALDRNDDEPSGWFNAAVYLAAAGDDDAATAAIDEGLALVDRPGYGAVARELLAVTRSELERVASDRPDAAALVDRLRTRLVEASQAGASTPTSPAVDPDEVELGGSPTFTVEGGQIHAEHRVAAPEGAPILFLWSVRQGPDGPWIEQPDAQEVGVARVGAVDGRPGAATAPVLDPGPCPGAEAEYRLEVWAGDVLASSDEAVDASGEPLRIGDGLGAAEPDRQARLGIEYCRPDAWSTARGAGEFESLAGAVAVVETPGPPWVSVALYAAFSGPVTGTEADVEQAAIGALYAEFAGRLDEGRLLLPETLPRAFDFAGDTGLLAEYVVEDEDPRYYAIGAALGDDGVLRSFVVRGDGPGRRAAEGFRDSIRFTPGPPVAAARREPQEDP